MELVFLRHAQPEWIVDGRSVGDPPLTAAGREQAARLAERAETWTRPTTIYVSPLVRAQETARPLCQRLGMAAETLPWLAEMRLPESWDGAPAARVQEMFVHMRQRRPEAWWDGMPEGGESFRQFYARITENLAALLSRHGAERPEPEAHPSLWRVREDSEARLVFVAHGGSNSAAISFLLGIEPVPWPWERFVSYHASISRLRTTAVFGENLFGLRLLSDVSHLPVELQTR